MTPGHLTIQSHTEPAIAQADDWDHVTTLMSRDGPDPLDSTRSLSLRDFAECLVGQNDWLEMAKLVGEEPAEEWPSITAKSRQLSAVASAIAVWRVLCASHARSLVRIARALAAGVRAGDGLASALAARYYMETLLRLGTVVGYAERIREIGADPSHEWLARLGALGNGKYAERICDVADPLLGVLSIRCAEHLLTRQFFHGGSAETWAFVDWVDLDESFHADADEMKAALEVCEEVPAQPVYNAVKVCAESFSSHWPDAKKQLTRCYDTLGEITHCERIAAYLWLCPETVWNGSTFVVDSRVAARQSVAPMGEHLLLQCLPVVLKLADLVAMRVKCVLLNVS